MKSICVFCGSSSGNNPDFLAAAKNLGKSLAQNDITLIYGGAAIGMMGAVADAVLAHGGKAVGVIPEFLSRKEIRHQHLTELITVKSMHQRKQQMAELSEGFIALPGGFGTLEEVCEIITWSQLGLVRHPVGILNVNGFYKHLLLQFDHMVEQGYLKRENHQIVIHSDQVQDLLQKMDDYQPVSVPKWLDLSKT